MFVEADPGAGRPFHCYSTTTYFVILNRVKNRVIVMELDLLEYCERMVPLGFDTGPEFKQGVPAPGPGRAG
jgi:hypothetical protein